MNSDNTPLSEKQKKQKEKNLKRIALEQAKNDEVNAKMESFRVEPIPSEIEHIQENKMYKTIKIASEKVEMLLNEKKMPSPQELVEFHKIMGKSPRKKYTEDLHIIQKELGEILCTIVRMGVNKTHTHQKNENKAPLASIKSALSRLEADYKNNKNGMISKEDVAWYNNILGITKSSDWLTKVGEIRTRLQRMIG